MSFPSCFRPTSFFCFASEFSRPRIRRVGGPTGISVKHPGLDWWILPAAYMASDLAEDTVIAAIFKSFIPLTTGWFRLLSTLTAIKIATISAAIGQVAILGALNALLFFFPAGKAI